jgi:hypothetical protein
VRENSAQPVSGLMSQLGRSGFRTLSMRRLLFPDNGHWLKARPTRIVTRIGSYEFGEPSTAVSPIEGYGTCGVCFLNIAGPAKSLGEPYRASGFLMPHRPGPE